MYHIIFYFKVGFTLFIKKCVQTMISQMLRQLPPPPPLQPAYNKQCTKLSKQWCRLFYNPLLILCQKVYKTLEQCLIKTTQPGECSTSPELRNFADYRQNNYTTYSRSLASGLEFGLITSCIIFAICSIPE